MSENTYENEIQNVSTEYQPWIGVKSLETSLPCPAFGSGGVTISTAVNGGTNVKGDFIGTVVGNDKLSISISYNYLTPEEFQKFLQVFDRTVSGGGYVNEYTVFDPRKNDFTELQMYVSDRSATPYSLDKFGRPTGWVSVSATLTEV